MLFDFYFYYIICNALYRYRNEAFNIARGIFQEIYFSELKDEESMDVEECSSQSRCPQRYKKRNRMMLSEWMIDVPQDFSENWFMVPCPVGKRTRLVSGRVVIFLYLHLFKINLYIYFKYEII